MKVEHARIFLVLAVLSVLLVTSLSSNAQQFVAAGGFTTCVLLSNNALKCFGKGGYNGNGNTTGFGVIAGTMGYNLPTVDLGVDYVAHKVAVGGNPSTGVVTVCAIVYQSSSPTTTTAVKCFGSNILGKAGWGRESTGSNLTFGDALDETGSAIPNVDLGVDLVPLDIAVGANHACAVVSSSDLAIERRVKCWGKGSNGALGNSQLNSTLGTSPSHMGSALPFMSVTGKVLGLALGNDFSCVIVSISSDTEGDVYCTGVQSSGQTGQDANSPAFIDTPALLNLGDTAVKVVAGRDHACALLTSNQVKCWGYGFDSAIGRYDTSSVGDGLGIPMANLQPLNFGAGLTVKDLEAGAISTCVILSDDTLKCFGRQEMFGVLGQGTTCAAMPSTQYMCSPNDVANIPPVNLGTSVTPLSLAMGSQHACARVSSPVGLRLKCWGRSDDGETGHENTNYYGTGSSASNGMGSFLPFTDVGELTAAPTTGSPTSQSPSLPPTKKPTSKTPTLSPVPSTSSPSDSPIKSPSKSPTIFSPTKSPVITKSPTRGDITQTPTQSETDATGATIGIAVGASAGGIVLLLVIFVLFKRGNSFSAGPIKDAPRNWLAEAQNASPETPSPYTLTAAATAASGKNKYFAPAQVMANQQPPQQIQMQYESGNPVFSGVAREASVRLSTPRNLEPIKPSKEQIFDKLRGFYGQVDPSKKLADIDDLAKWVILHGEEALYVKLRQKYGTDPNSLPARTQPKLVFKDDVEF